MNPEPTTELKNYGSKAILAILHESQSFYRKWLLNWKLAGRAQVTYIFIFEGLLNSILDDMNLYISELRQSTCLRLNNFVKMFSMNKARSQNLIKLFSNVKRAPKYHQLRYSDMKLKNIQKY